MKADAILCADIHLREDQPECRTDDYWKAQKKAIRFLRKLQQTHDCPVLVAGDIFNHHKPSPYLLAWAIGSLPNKMYTIAGQHDLKNHSVKLFEKCGLRVLESAQCVKVMTGRRKRPVGAGATLLGYPYGVPVTHNTKKTSERKVLMLHTLVWNKKKPWAECKAGKAGVLLKKLKGYDLIVTGDNHIPFVVERDGRLLVNPGSLMRMTAKQIKHKPRVYLWYAEANEVEKVYLPIEEGVISREHIDKVEKRDERIDAFVERLRTDMKEDIGLSFEKNLKMFFSKNGTRKEVRELVWEAMEDE